MVYEAKNSYIKLAQNKNFLKKIKFRITLQRIKESKLIKFRRKMFEF